MARYSNDVINEVFSENDIIDYISQYVVLKKSGRDYSGLCPFHKEKTPSFHVSREKQLFHCFGCGASGNLVQFVMRAEGIDFVEALKLLADRAGIVLPEDNNQIDYALHEKKKKIYEMNKIAAHFFYDRLTKSEDGKEAVRYLLSRRLTKRIINVYGLGYAPEGHDTLYQYMKKQGYSDKDILDAGLASERNNKFYDRFRDRVIFPIIDLRGNVIGFGGRIMKQSEEASGFKPPKYLNSAETPVFNKGKNLFSLNFAKKDGSGKLILVEGYMDVISVYQAGLINVVATLGTALTEDQAKLMLKYCSEILICYDSDEAGQKAAVRAIDIINAAGGRSKVIRLKGAKDPDEYIKANGAEAFRQAVKGALPSTEYRLSSLKSHYNLDIPDGKVLFIDEAAKILAGLDDAVEADVYMKKIASETDIDIDAVRSEYKKARKTNNIQKPKYIPIVQKRVADSESSRGTLPVHTSGSRSQNAEKKLINLISQNKKFCTTARGILEPDDFSNDVYKTLVKRIYENCAQDRVSEPAILLNGFEGDKLKTASEIFYNLEVYDDDERVFKELVVSMKKEKLKERILTEKDPAKLKELLDEQTALGKNKI